MRWLTRWDFPTRRSRVTLHPDFSSNKAVDSAEWFNHDVRNIRAAALESDSKLRTTLRDIFARRAAKGR